MIVVPAVHPAWDLIATVDRLAPGRVHRAARLVTVVGGKAVNVARVAAALGADVRLILLADERLAAAVAEDVSLRPLNLRIQVVLSPVPSRSDLAIVERGGRLTVVNGRAADPGATARRQFEDACRAHVRSGDVLVLAGSAPPGATALIGRLAGAGRSAGARVVVDASGRCLRATLRAGPEAVKVSEAEVGGPVDGARPGLLASVPIVGITRGERGLRAWVGARAVEVVHPGNVEVINPLGAGDAVTAGLAVSLAAGGDPIDGFALGVATATVRLRRLEPVVDAAEIRAVVPRIRVTRLA